MKKANCKEEISQLGIFSFTYKMQHKDSVFFLSFNPIYSIKNKTIPKPVKSINFVPDINSYSQTKYKMPVIAPSILAANFLRLGEAIEMINQSEAQWIHCDVMDGKFVPNISFGMPVLEAVKTASRKVMDVHLMIVEPERYLQTFKNCGADVLTIHQEACTHLHRTLQAIRDLGMKAGVALNPSTPISTLEEVLPLIDVVCLMSVNPGFGGQKFISSVIDKTFRLKQLIEKAGTKTLIEIDGGVNISNAPTLIQAGAEVLVAGNFVFSAPDPIDIIAQMASIKPVINA